MLSPPDLIVIGAAALLFFGPDQLPKVARRAGQVVREVQNTSQAFIREIERAADEPAEPVSRHDWAADAVDRSVPGGPDRAPGSGAGRLVEPAYTPDGPVYAPAPGGAVERSEPASRAEAAPPLVSPARPATDREPTIVTHDGDRTASRADADRDAGSREG